MDSPLARWHQFISDHYDLEEFRTLCTYLGVDDGDRRGSGVYRRRLVRGLRAYREVG